MEQTATQEHDSASKAVTAKAKLALQKSSKVNSLRSQERLSTSPRQTPKRKAAASNKGTSKILMNHDRGYCCHIAAVLDESAGHEAVLIQSAAKELLPFSGGAAHGAAAA